MPPRRSLPLLTLAAGALVLAVAPRADAHPPRGYTQFVSSTVVIPAGQQVRRELPCPPAKVPLGGGAAFNEPGLAGSINSSFPMGNSWIVDLNNTGPVPIEAGAVVLCARVPKGHTL